jgi:hypothetical protein
MEFPKLPRLIEITLERSKRELREALAVLYKRSSVTLTPASPYGQIIQVLEALKIQVFKYIENVLAESSIARAQHPTSIRGHAVTAGYIPTRSIGATGSIRFSLKPGIDIADEIPGSVIIIRNNTRILNLSNRLNYIIKTTGSQATFEITPDVSFVLPVIQGKLQQQVRTSDGSILQSYQISNRGSDIDNFEVEVTVNGNLWENKRSIREMLPNEQAVVVRTGLDGNSLDIIFGNGDMGAVPNRGARIEITYLVVDGAAGVININKPNDFQFIDDIFDGLGDEIDITRIFDVNIDKNISFGSDADDIEFIRAIVPYVSRNDVLALPQHFEFALKRLGQFSYVEAFSELEDDDPSNDRTVYLYLIPNLRILTSGGINYFDIPESAFVYSEQDKNRILEHLTKMGTIFMGTEVKILNLNLSRYVLYAFVRLFDDADEQVVREAINSAVTDYFLAFNRRDRVPGSDIIKAIDNIDGVDSVNIKFISQKNEVYHAAAKEYIERVRRTDPTRAIETIKVPNYDPNANLGLNRSIEEIVLEPNEIVILRGGWRDRNGLEYTPGIQEGKLGPVNIVFDQIRSRRRN